MPKAARTRVQRGSSPQSGSAPKRGLSIERVAIDTLHEDPANVRKHGAKNLAAIRASLLEFGQVEPLVILAASGRVIGGNGRLGVMRDLGWTEVDVVRFEGTETKARALAIALNRAGELAEWDETSLVETLQALAREDFAPARIGFDQADLDALIAGALPRADGTESARHKTSSAQAGSDESAPLIPERFEILIVCKSEQEQLALIERLIAEGHECRALIS